MLITLLQVLATAVFYCVKGQVLWVVHTMCKSSWLYLQCWVPCLSRPKQQHSMSHGSEVGGKDFKFSHGQIHVHGRECCVHALNLFYCYIFVVATYISVSCTIIVYIRFDEYKQRGGCALFPGLICLAAKVTKIIQMQKHVCWSLGNWSD